MIERGTRLPLAVLLISLCSLSPAAVGAETPNGAAALERFLTDVRTLTAGFEQELWSADEELIETASGSLSLQRPNRFMWRYEAPIEQLIVADGERLWMYDIELAQVTVTDLDSPTASSPAMLLSGDQGVRESFDVVETSSFDGIDWVRLEPALPDTDFRSVLIGFEAGRLARMELVDGLDQVTRIRFFDVSVNPQLSEDLFVFEPPAGVDVIGAE